MGNFFCVEENPVTAVLRLAPYALHARAKDMLVREKPFYGHRIISRGGNYHVGTVMEKAV